MTHPFCLRILTIFGLILALGSCAVPQDDPVSRVSITKETPPNIVWIIADDQAYSDFGFMGHDLVRTPNLDKLASESALFLNGYVPSSLCRASLATLITGKYAFDHGICFNDPPDGIPHSATFRFLEMQEPIPRALMAKGYRSLQTGKFWEGVYTNGGFTDGMTQGTRHGDAGLRIGRSTMEPIEQFLGDVGDDPFFIWFAPYLPHAPFDAVEAYKEPFRDKGLGRREIGYYANISWLDDTVGQLIELLEKSGKANDTVIMFIVDNGWLPNRDGESFRDLQGRNLRFDARSKQSPYEGGVRTPVFVHWPGRIEPARYNDSVSSIDFFPTTLAFAGAPHNNQLPGRNLQPFFDRRASMAPRTVFGEIYYHTSVDLDDPKVNMTHRWARNGDWKLILNDHDEGRPELYNLASDPDENDNLAGDPEHAERVAAIRAEIEQWWPD
uniref:sulfatase family protein n=1 Tax=uncultured Altererythrobacter sp. TaxID=500840 RepID=UPI00261F1A11|nr:sulfatase [uncultured Altererythrobacter sp.]